VVIKREGNISLQVLNFHLDYNLIFKNEQKKQTL
jgi:hypothetical protein